MRNTVNAPVAQGDYCCLLCRLIVMPGSRTAHQNCRRALTVRRNRYYAAREQERIVRALVAAGR